MSQFKAAYNWDQTNFSLPVHEKLAEQHFELDSATKMRNHLAEDVLDRMMLFLMQVVCCLVLSVNDDNTWILPWLLDPPFGVRLLSGATLILYPVLDPQV